MRLNINQIYIKQPAEIEDYDHPSDAFQISNTRSVTLSSPPNQTHPSFIHP